MFAWLLNRKKEIKFERVYEAPIETVWQAWTDPEILKKWWGPKEIFVPECEINLQVGGRIFLVMEAGEAMGSYKGTRWPMEGTFTEIQKPHRLTYTAQAWTEGEKDSSTIDQVNDLVLKEENGKTVMILKVTIVKVGSGAKLAAFGMKWGYKAQFDKLGDFLKQ